MCPHAAIRPVLATPEELKGAPAGFNTLPIKGSKELSQYQYRMQVRALPLLSATFVLPSGMHAD